MICVAFFGPIHSVIVAGSEVLSNRSVKHVTARGGSQFRPYLGFMPLGSGSFQILHHHGFNVVRLRPLQRASMRD